MLSGDSMPRFSGYDLPGADEVNPCHSHCQSAVLLFLQDAVTRDNIIAIARLFCIALLHDKFAKTINYSDCDRSHRLSPIVMRHAHATTRTITVSGAPSNCCIPFCEVMPAYMTHALAREFQIQ